MPLRVVGPELSEKGVDWVGIMRVLAVIVAMVVVRDTYLSSLKMRASALRVRCSRAKEGRTVRMFRECDEALMRAADTHRGRSLLGRGKGIDRSMA